MKRIVLVAALAALAAPALQAQSTGGQSNAHEQLPSQSAYNLQQNDGRTRAQSFNATAESERRAYINSLGNLTKLRTKLAEAWQTIGLSPQAAKGVAAAYQPNFALNSRRASLHGKSGQEIAAILQAALARKDYLLANQTLIDYERDKLQLGTDTSPDGMH